MKPSQIENDLETAGSSCVQEIPTVLGASTTIDIIVADDHPVVTHGVRCVLERAPGIRVMAEAHSVADMIAALGAHPCDVLICDYSFDGDPEPDGLRMIERIRRTYPELKIVLLTMLNDQWLVQGALKRGVCAFLSKETDNIVDLPRIITSVMRGKTYIDTEIASAIFSNMAECASGTLASQSLSPRELEVVRLYEQGMKVSEIAQRLMRSRKTISTQKASAMKKLGARTDVELVDAARKIL